jgi:dTDP-glucose pyrophosphorylase
MQNFDRHLISRAATIREALVQINALGKKLVLFVVDPGGALLGTLTDGDIRRALIAGAVLDAPVEKVMHRDYRCLNNGVDPLEMIARLRADAITMVPVIDQNRRLVNVIDLEATRTLLPLDAIVMAGGEGRRLRPFTDTIPKPLLKVGDRPIIEHNLSLLARYGVTNIAIAIRHFGDQIVDRYGDGASHGWNLSYIREPAALGTIGAARMATNLRQESLLVMNSDVLTNIDFEDFYREFLAAKADFAIATVSYRVSVPFAVLELNQCTVTSLREKPEYTYQSNAGIYILKRAVLGEIPSEGPFHATDLIERLVQTGRRVISYPLRGYWQDIGRPEEYRKAQEDVNHIRF